MPALVVCKQCRSCTQSLLVECHRADCNFAQPELLARCGDQNLLIHTEGKKCDFQSGGNAIPGIPISLHIGKTFAADGQCAAATAASLEGVTKF